MHKNYPVLFIYGYVNTQKCDLVIWLLLIELPFFNIIFRHCRKFWRFDLFGEEKLTNLQPGIFEYFHFESDSKYEPDLNWFLFLFYVSLPYILEKEPLQIRLIFLKDLKKEFPKNHDAINSQTVNVCTVGEKFSHDRPIWYLRIS